MSDIRKNIKENNISILLKSKNIEENYQKKICFQKVSLLLLLNFLVLFPETQESSVPNSAPFKQYFTNPNVGMHRLNSI